MNCRLKNLVKVVFFDGTKKSADEVCKVFNSEFEWMMWKEPFPSKEKGMKLIYHCHYDNQCHDGEYDNVVPDNVYIFQLNFGRGHLVHTDWLTKEEFEKNFVDVSESNIPLADKFINQEFPFATSISSLKKNDIVLLLCKFHESIIHGWL